MFLGSPVNFRKIGFLIRGAILLEKVVTEKSGKVVEKKRMVKKAVHYVITSRPPDQRPTVTIYDN